MLMLHSTLVIWKAYIDSEAVECASDELSETMHDLFRVVGLVYKRLGKYVAIYSQPQYSIL